MTQIAITVIYDNNHYDNRLLPAWGCSCMVNFPQNTTLFDIGGNGTVALHNMSKLEIDPVSSLSQIRDMVLGTC